MTVTTVMMGKTTPPLPRLMRRQQNGRVYEKALALGVSDVVARVLAGRGLAPDADLKAFLEARLSSLDAPDTLADIEPAAKRIARAIMGGETIGLCTDYDCDGSDAHAALWRAIVEIFGHPREKMLSFVGHRLEEGYGLTEPVANRILAARPRPTLLITADQGSSDEVQIARLRAAGIVTIVSDHHSLPITGPPASAYACINPQRLDCAYPDDAIAGGMVAWLVMCAVRRELIAAGWLPASRGNPLVDLLDYVAVSTTADCVSMSSVNNRAVVRAGLQLMNTKTRACWAGMKPLLRTQVFSAETIAFGIAPRIHARSRLADSVLGLDFLLADDVNEAGRLAQVLDGHNQERKLIEREMLEMALAEAESRVAGGRSGLSLLLTEGHAGVIGLSSSRIVERFGRPTFVFAPAANDDTLITGSGRSIDEVHLRNALQWMADRRTGLFTSPGTKMGGHRAAAGARVLRRDFEEFEEAFDLAVRAQVGDTVLGPCRWSDGELRPEEISLETVTQLELLEPTGRGFEPARFDGQFLVDDVRAVGDGTHLKLGLRLASQRYSGIWFKARASKDAPLPVEPRELAHFVFGLQANEFRGERRLDLVIEARVN